jgi:hypothetical protein
MIKKLILKKLDTVDIKEGEYINENDIKIIIDYDCDVFDEDLNILIKFRKNVLSKKNIDIFYENAINHAKSGSSNRGYAGGFTDNYTKKNIRKKQQVKSSIAGYFDTISPSLKYQIKQKNLEKVKCRLTSFSTNHFDKWEKMKPLIKEIDTQYKLLAPEYYNLQYQESEKTWYKIQDTSFYTITLNLNFQTRLHKDKGDFKNGLGNLVVIEKGEYQGGYTCIPEYGIGVDVRTGDCLLMDVHKYHGNTEIKLKDKDSQRLSIVSYFREGLVKKCNKEQIDYIVDNDYFFK